MTKFVFYGLVHQVPQRDSVLLIKLSTLPLNLEGKLHAFILRSTDGQRWQGCKKRNRLHVSRLLLDWIHQNKVGHLVMFTRQKSYFKLDS